jgi:hypothetical protein
MTLHIEIDLPDQCFSGLWTSPEDFVQQMRLTAAIKWYEMGKISTSTASEIAGISVPAFSVALTQFQFSPSSQATTGMDFAEENDDNQDLLKALRDELRQTHPFTNLSKSEILAKLRQTREAVYDELYGYRHHAN